jgi:enoyl-CoA hydratase/carnithine racemase
MSGTWTSRLTRAGRGVVTYTVDDAATRNALSIAVLEHIDRTLTELAEDSSVRLILFTGAGTVFSSGADRAELGDPVTIERTTALLSSILTQIDESRVPVVARVNGGARLTIAAAADTTIDSTDAIFGLPEVRVSLVAGPAAASCMDASVMLPHLTCCSPAGASEATRLVGST